MLLTSAQVSVAFSSGIVFIFTAALFLSGYAIQQRTVRDLRQAIKPTPRPSPKTYLPDQFKKMKVELPDGTIVPVRDDGMVIEINPTTPKEARETSETGEENQQKKPIPALEPAPESIPEKAKNKKTSSERARKYREQQQLKKQQQRQQEGLVVQQGQQQQDYSTRPNQAEQQETTQGLLIEIPEGMLEHPDPNMRAEKAVSPAERRRLIKEEIQRLAQPEERGYYQRRLW
ncbi:hypothetical protein QBC32DRAFT_336570 [Pseudoneurospora amorphoporcata]|uniref:Uncharacterized protein n=1 Tax=Pseudoneurospora amorphoporcata TaxID=241081 RepID=A0AAN6P0N1_9PEZI|nr:hypothetical protein QBC32DRAFT_336570 [Pseudoneurospora amorphoporcata]